MDKQYAEVAVEQQSISPERGELQFIVAEEWPSECCIALAAPPAVEAAPCDDDEDWDEGLCVA